jgi:hypothetical protein
MPCFCTVPADAVRQRFSLSMSPLLPPIPLSMKLALALPALTPENRLDMQIAAGFNPASLPNIDFGGGPLAQIAMTLSLMGGTFALDDLPLLEFQMAQAAASITQNIWPRLGWLASLKTQPLINYSLVARMVLDLSALGIDPFDVSSFPGMPEGGASMGSFRFVLTPPHLRMANLLAGLPLLMQMNEALALPPFGEAGAVSALNNRLSVLAQLTPPSLAIPMPVLTKLALVLNSLATIQGAFGEDAFSPATLNRVRMMLSLWGQFSIPFPLPALALNAKLDPLPALEDIRLGERLAGSMSFAFAEGHFSPPQLSIAPFMNVVLALGGSLQMALDMAAMEPFDMCALCPCG